MITEKQARILRHLANKQSVNGVEMWKLFSTSDGLTDMGYIENRHKAQWTITDAGRVALAEYDAQQPVSKHPLQKWIEETAADDLSELQQALNANAALQVRVEQLEALLHEAAQVITPIAMAYINGINGLVDRRSIAAESPFDGTYHDINYDIAKPLQVLHFRMIAEFAAKLAARE